MQTANIIASILNMSASPTLSATKSDEKKNGNFQKLLESTISNTQPDKPENETGGHKAERAQGKQPAKETESSETDEGAMQNSATVLVQPQLVPLIAQPTEQQIIEQVVDLIATEAVVTALPTSVAPENAQKTSAEMPLSTPDDDSIPDSAIIERAKIVTEEAAETVAVPQQPMPNQKNTQQDKLSGMMEKAANELKDMEAGKDTVSARASQQAEQPVNKPPLSELQRVSEMPKRTATEEQKPEIPLQNIQAAEALKQPEAPRLVTVAAKPEPVQQAMPAEQIQTKVIENIDNQRMEFEMSLYPRELGKLDISMVLEQGKLAVQIIAQSAKTEALLRTQSAGLIASLKASGYELSSVQVVTQTEQTHTHLYGGLNSGYSNENAEQNAGHGERNQNGRRQPQEQSREKPQWTEEPKRLLNYAV